MKDAVGAGYVALKPAADDARRRDVSITAAGLELLQGAHRWQELTFDRLTEGWTHDQKAELQRAMLSLLDRPHTLESHTGEQLT